MINTYLFSQNGVEENVPFDDWRSLISDGNKLLWVDARAFTDDELADLADKFGLHSLEVDACKDGYNRPHLYEFADHFYVNMTTVTKNGKRNHTLKPSELHLFAGEGFVLTVTHESGCDAVDKALQEYKATPALSTKGAIYAVYLLAEDLVETYYPIVEQLDDEADQLEDVMLDKADKQSIRKLFTLKRRGFELRKLLGPQRDIFNEINRRDFPFIQGEDKVYFQDVYNRMIRLFDMMDTIREILSGSLDIYLSTVSNRLNEVMKVLTVFATILMMLSFITGFYGMNFVHLPWLQSPNAFRNIVLFMVAITGGMLWWFKKKGWV